MATTAIKHAKSNLRPSTKNRIIIPIRPHNVAPDSLTNRLASLVAFNSLAVVLIQGVSS